MKKIDLTGQRFGKLLVVERSGTKNDKAIWKCQCDCGNISFANTSNLRRGNTRSCGCLSIECITNLNKGKSLMIDLSGQKFGRLTVLEFSHFSKDKKRTYWKCRCDCGKEIITRADGMKSGHTNSCGCYNKDVVAEIKPSKTHGLSDEKVYKIWAGMKNRCYNHKSIEYNIYGGRGITVCDEWRNNPEAFIEWAYENGFDKNKREKEQSIDRIDVNKGYSPDNCRFANATTQANNTRSNVNISYSGKTQTLAQWCRELGLPYSTIGNRLRSGWGIIEALETPIGAKR